MLRFRFCKPAGRWVTQVSGAGDAPSLESPVLPGRTALTPVGFCFVCTPVSSTKAKLLTLGVSREVKLLSQSKPSQ